MQSSIGMTIERLNKEEIFNRAAELADVAERHAYLDEACAGDLKLRAEIEDLLKLDENAGSFLASPPVEFRAKEQRSLIEKRGMKIGPYKLREQIGEGGFGVVFVAEQVKPVRRKVALKVIKPGMDTKEVVARFEAERQALALMDHPNVACVLDAGTTDSGRPYFAMELIHGVSITEFCDSQKSSTKERLEMFVDVCRAVQHAHQKGIIHRDIKPSNVMVTMHDHRPVVKVIDFGVAKALATFLTNKTIYTAYGQMIGTPMYMSPEQAQLSGLEVDTRSDVYSLGVLAYELLTGSPPFDKESLEKAGFDEMRRIILEEEPRRPSVLVSTLKAEQLSTVCDRRKIDAGRLSPSLQGELDWIVMKSLDKDRTRRYETAASLADDVNRYLAGEAVQACPPTTTYLVNKFVRRHRASVTLAATILLLLVAGIGGTIWQAVQATAQKNRAVAAEALAENRLLESEASRFEALAAKQNAEAAQKKAEAARKEAESARQEAELARRQAEAASIAILKQLRAVADDGKLYQAPPYSGDKKWVSKISLDEIESARKAVAKAFEEDPNMIEWIVAFGWAEEIRDHIIAKVKEDAPIVNRHYFQLAVDLAEPELYPFLHKTVLKSPWPMKQIEMLRRLPNYDLNKTIAQSWRRENVVFDEDTMAIAAAQAGEPSALTYLIGMLNVAGDHGRLKVAGYQWRDHVLRVVAFRGSDQEIIEWHQANCDKIVFDKSTGKFFLPGDKPWNDDADDIVDQRRKRILEQWAQGEEALGRHALGAAVAAAEYGDTAALEYLMKKLKVSVVRWTTVNEDGNSYILYTNDHRNAVLRVVAFRGSNKEMIDWYNANKDKIVFDPAKRKFILPDAE